MRSLKNPLSIAFVFAVSVLGLSACSPSAPEAEDLKIATQELKDRGFTDPRWETNINSYTVGVGSCRLPAYVGSSDWTVKVPSKGSVDGIGIRYANIDLLKKQQGLADCFNKG